MKKTALILLGLLVCNIAGAQLTLSGTSYSQNFDSIGNGLPAGWYVYTKAKAGSAGTDVSANKYVATHTRWNSTTGNFRNVASANSFTTPADTAAQSSATDRALGVRQVGYSNQGFPGSDSGAAFVLQLSNTTYLSGFQASFKLQSLDTSSSRTTIWSVDYAFGNNPTVFTPAAISGTNVTGNKTYSNNTITVNFDTVLDNQPGAVWIRIVALSPSGGSGNRTTSAIDDFTMTWLNNTPNPFLVSFTPANNMTGVSAGTDLNIAFDKAVNAGAGTINVTNETDQTVYTIAAGSTDVIISNNLVTVSNLNLLNGKTYHVTIDTNAFDSAGFSFAGIADTIIWRFSTGPNGIASVKGAHNIPVAIIGAAFGSSICVGFTARENASFRASVYDLNGREVYCREITAVKGNNAIVLTPLCLISGLYIVRISGDSGYGAAKAIVE